MEMRRTQAGQIMTDLTGQGSVRGSLVRRCKGDHYNWVRYACIRYAYRSPHGYRLHVLEAKGDKMR